MSAETITAADLPWRCPDCRSTELLVGYTERRASGVTTSPGGDQPWPSYLPDEHIELDVDSFSFECTACGAQEIAPTQQESGPDSAEIDRAARQLAEEMESTVRGLGAAQASLERGRAIAARYHWIPMALALAAARDHLGSIATSLDTEGIAP